VATVQDEVRQRFGLVPNFFRLAPEVPDIAEDLWGFARFAYLDNPLPSLFKERLFVWLSRFCEVRYCIARHVGFLVGLGRAAGDPHAQVQSVDAIVRLLTRPVPRGEALRAHIAQCARLDQPVAQLPAPDSELECAMFGCATQLFLHPGAEPDCTPALRHALGPARMEYMRLLLAFVHTAHYWTALHPELVFEDDLKRMLATHRMLGQCVLDDPEAGCSAIGRRLLAEVDTLRHEKQQLARETELHLERDLADSRLLHNISNELIGEQHVDTLYGKIIDAAVRLVHGTGGSMQVLAAGPGGRRELKLLGQRGLGPEAVAFWDRVQAGEATSCGAALASGQRVVVPDVERCEFMAGTEDLEMYRKMHIRAVQTTALHTRTGAMVGCFSTYWHEPYQPSEHELQMLDILARQAADLLERAKVEEALRASEDRFRRALQPQNVGILFFDTSGRIKEANEAFLHMSGFTRADLAAGRLRWDRMTPPEWMDGTRRALEEFVTQGWTTPYEKEYFHKDGSRWWGLFEATRLSGDDGVEFVIDITDRKRTEQALKDADRRKDVFIATLAHELRNPLAPISNAVQLLRRTDGRRKADQLMDMVERQVRQIVRLVDDLLEVSRITSGKIELHKAPVALSEIVHDALQTSKPLIDQSRHMLTVSLPAEQVTLDADSVRLTQVLANLLNNAAKYTETGGHIWLTARRDGAGVVLSVRDNGSGIAADKLPQIFDLFAQADQRSGRGQGGLGIGLTMARSLVEMHGGSIEAHSAGLEAGSEFIVHLPLPECPAADPAQQRGMQDHVPLSGQRILVVDDNQDAADSLGMLLQADGAEVQVAHDGRAALAAAARFGPRTVLLDLGMPGMDGYEVARELRRDPRWQALRIIALTGWGQEADRQKTSASGFDFHMTKPIDLDALKAWLTGGGKQV
jgi:PAS domain S-box-containing protein